MLKGAFACLTLTITGHRHLQTIFSHQVLHTAGTEAGPQGTPEVASRNSLPDPQPDCFLMLWLCLPCWPCDRKGGVFFHSFSHQELTARTMYFPGNKGPGRDFPGSPAFKTVHLHCRVQVQSLVSEPRSYMPNRGQNLKQNKTKGQTDMRSSSLGPQRILSQPSAFRQCPGLLDK